MKNKLILKYFQKKDQLTTANPPYQKTLTDLFHWLTTNDAVTKDQTTQLLFKPIIHNVQLTTTASILTRQPLIVAGLEETAFLLKTHTQLTCKLRLKDGCQAQKGQTLLEITGKTAEILAYERTILNLLQRLCGIATETNKICRILEATGDVSGNEIRKQDEFFDRSVIRNLSYLTKPKNIASKKNLSANEFPGWQNPPFIAATRKTPWMSLDKKAVACGGGLTHRLSLADGILVKDNHLTHLTAKEAIAAILPKLDHQLIEIEVEKENEIYEVLDIFKKRNTTNVLAVMFDNFSARQVQTILNNLNDLDRNQTIFEASGGINEDNIKEWAKTGVDILSLGSLTHSVRAADLSLRLNTNSPQINRVT